MRILASGVAAVAAVLAAVPADAWSEGRYTVRNGTSRTFTCGLRQERRSVIDRFVLRAGAEWQQEARRDGQRVLMCDSWRITQRWRMHSGVPYELVEDRNTGFVVLRSMVAAE